MFWNVQLRSIGANGIGYGFRCRLKARTYPQTLT